ncbi:MAG TPA: bifunctional ADP-heptose synthase [Gemmatimonadaceae bacterium]|jgi:D-beta-D-heptose 7-phosphate kinase/D-beta-D-heptose 1-phosphate adenosyltransferase|nr:bifunctional ADP-heptose synthase [Gemmatimonadaceae bacterium]
MVDQLQAPLIERTRLVELLERARKVHVLVIGDAMLDVYLQGDVERISPEAPVPVVRVREQRAALGGAANVAQNVVAAGAGATLVATVGRDAAGAALREMLVRLGCADSALIPVDRPTTRKTRLVARSQQVVRFDEEDDSELDSEAIDLVLGSINSALAKADAVVFEDYNKGLLTARVIAAAIEKARARTLPIVVDPKYRNFFAYRGATIFKPNRRELESALGATMDLDHEPSLPRAFEKLGVEHLLLTLGERGMLLMSATGDSQRIPTTAREVYDVVGAGDTVTAYLAVMLAAKASAHEAAVVANYAAGVEVAKLGAATVTPDELLEAHDGHTGR